MGLRSKIRRLRRISKNKGSTYLCPFCGYSSIGWNTIGRDNTVIYEKQIIGGGRREAGCHRCNSSDRERLIYTYLIEYSRALAEPEQVELLHMAPEANLTQYLDKLNLKLYECGDLFTPGYKYPKYVKNINVLNLPYEDNSFDMIICNHVLEHIIDDIAAMKELFRVLRPGKFAILQVPISAILDQTYEDQAITEPEDRERIFGQTDHVRIYGEDYINRLQLAGFSVERINISDQYPKYGLNLKEDLFICTKVNG